MSDDETPENPPAPETPPAPTPAPAAAPVQPAPVVPPRPVIDYAMPTQKASWLPTPALVRNLGCLFKLIVGFTVLICMGYFALVALNPKARKWALQGTKPGPGGAPPSGKGPTPFKIVNQILAIPAQALGKTDDVVKANNARVGQLDGVIADAEKSKSGRGARPVVDPFANPAARGNGKGAGTATVEADGAAQSVSGAHLLALAEKNGDSSPQEPTPSSLPARPAVTAPAAPETPNQMKLAGDIVITQASPADAPRASASFFYTIVKLTVSGVTQGTASKPARALINNRLAYEGDEINRPLGITFTQLDATNKVLVFRDQSGATITRSY